ncbi:hypothetical protein AAY473_008833 [Plecturocebus cupreus]
MVTISRPRDPHTSASQSATITGMSHCAQPLDNFYRHLRGDYLGFFHIMAPNAKRMKVKAERTLEV